MGKMPIDRERFAMVVILREIVAETCFRRNVRIWLRSHCLLRQACRSLVTSLIDAGGNDDMTRSKRAVGMRGIGKGSDEILR